jgi:hypothetical protein
MRQRYVRDRGCFQACDLHEGCSCVNGVPNTKYVLVKPIGRSIATPQRHITKITGEAYYVKIFWVEYYHQDPYNDQYTPGHVLKT